MQHNRLVALDQLAYNSTDICIWLRYGTQCWHVYHTVIRTMSRWHLYHHIVVLSVLRFLGPLSFVGDRFLIPLLWSRRSWGLFRLFIRCCCPFWHVIQGIGEEDVKIKTALSQEAEGRWCRCKLLVRDQPKVKCLYIIAVCLVYRSGLQQLSKLEYWKGKDTLQTHLF